MAEQPFWAAVSSIRSGLSARAGLRAYRAGGGAVQDATWYKLVTHAKDVISAGRAELDAPLNRRPTSGEASILPTRNASGWLQLVHVVVKDRQTGDISAIPYSVTGTRPITRQDAIDAALETYTPDSGSPPGGQQVLGAMYARSMIMQPGTAS